MEMLFRYFLLSADSIVFNFPMYDKIFGVCEFPFSPYFPLRDNGTFMFFLRLIVVLHRCQLPDRDLRFYDFAFGEEWKLKFGNWFQ